MGYGFSGTLLDNPFEPDEMICDLKHYLRIRDLVKMGRRVLYEKYRLWIHSISLPLLTIYAVDLGVGMAVKVSDGGIKGKVLIGPVCPVESKYQPCPDRPLEASIEISEKFD